MPNKRGREGQRLDDIRAKIGRSGRNNNNDTTQSNHQSTRPTRRNKSSKKKSKDRLISATNIKHNVNALHSM